MAEWNYNEMYDNIRAPLWNAARMQSSGENRIVEELFKFIEEWYHNYKVVCEDFDLYYKVPIAGFIYHNFKKGFESFENRKTDFFSVNFFEKILQKMCIFEKITPPTYNYDGFNESRAYNHYIKSLDSKLCIMSEHFTLSRESSDANKVWTLDTKMANNQSPQQGLVLSLIVTLMGNYVPLSLYKRNKHFRNFIDKFSEVTQFDFRFEGHDKALVVYEGVVRSVPDYTTFKCGKWSDESVVIDHDRSNSGNLRFTYKHLDELFGKNREERLTDQDLQLYSICNEGRKPFIYDWEFNI